MMRGATLSFSFCNLFSWLLQFGLKPPTIAFTFCFAILLANLSWFQIFSLVPYFHLAQDITLTHHCQLKCNK